MAHEAPRSGDNEDGNELYQEKDHVVLWETHMMLVILLVLKGKRG